MTIDATIVSKVQVLDSNAACYDSIKAFGDSHYLIGLNVQPDDIRSDLKSNVDFGAILLAEEYGDNPHGGVPLGRVPLVVNHLHRYISFGSENPQLSFKYRLPDGDHKDEKSMVIDQRFVFNLSRSPEDFKEDQFSTVDELFDSGELELF